MEFELRCVNGRLICKLDSKNAHQVISKAKGVPIIGGYKLTESITFNMNLGFTFYFWAESTIKMKI